MTTETDMISDFTGEDSYKEIPSFTRLKNTTEEIKLNQNFNNKYDVSSYPKVHPVAQFE